MLISGTKISIVENKNGKASFWHGELLQVCPVAKIELTKLPPLTSPAVIKCFCAGLVKTPNTLVKLSYLQIGLGPFTVLGHVWVVLRHYCVSPRWLCGPFMWILVYLRDGHCRDLGGLLFLDLRSLVFSFLFLNLALRLGNHIPL